ncbi:MAG: hypothetical protein SVS15_01185 [Thermodesulfobacteriota bacterium]|nr:hypothetical protein [Thermodesulfobacteriota bacterium]
MYVFFACGKGKNAVLTLRGFSSAPGKEAYNPLARRSAGPWIFPIISANRAVRNGLFTFLPRAKKFLVFLLVGFGKSVVLSCRTELGGEGSASRGVLPGKKINIFFPGNKNSSKERLKRVEGSFGINKGKDRDG